MKVTGVFFFLSFPNHPEFTRHKQQVGAKPNVPQKHCGALAALDVLCAHQLLIVTAFELH